jgi:hypothetical protein
MSSRTIYKQEKLCSNAKSMSYNIIRAEKGVYYIIIFFIFLSLYLYRALCMKLWITFFCRYLLGAPAHALTNMSTRVTRGCYALSLPTVIP